MVTKNWTLISLDENGPYVNLNNGNPCTHMSYFDKGKCWIIIPCFAIGSDGKALSVRNSKPEDICDIKDEWANYYKESVEKSCIDEEKFFYEFRFGNYIGLVGSKRELTLETYEAIMEEVNKRK
jgi:hypothetical protein